MKKFINKIITFLKGLFSEIQTEIKENPLRKIIKKSKEERIKIALQNQRRFKAYRNQGKRYASTKSFNSVVYGIRQ